ncbi:hypothetical protein Cni_G25222 [Canna indica]|uniref:Uncharacterized protein n=1 Tax=Canna indica TaxID=4628 RepID=A0AAQ3KXG9_9LILI|nr:hypothetical protein Cni_G25222 [Canna indica]
MSGRGYRRRRASESPIGETPALTHAADPPAADPPVADPHADDTAEASTSRRRRPRGPNRWQPPPATESRRLISVIEERFEQEEVPRSISSTIRRYMHGAWPTWSHVPSEHVDMLWREFEAHSGHARAVLGPLGAPTPPVAGEQPSTSRSSYDHSSRIRTLEETVARQSRMMEEMHAMLRNMSGHPEAGISSASSNPSSSSQSTLVYTQALQTPPYDPDHPPS